MADAPAQADAREDREPEPGPLHPIAEAVLRAWRGPREPVDGSWHRVPPWRPGVYAVVALTGRAYISAPEEVTDAELAGLGADGWGHAHDPRVMARLAGPDGWVDVLDALLVAEGTGGPPPAGLVERPDLTHHPRVRHALPLRDDLRILGRPTGDSVVLVLARGIAGLTEMSFELDPELRGHGEGTALARAARALVPAGVPLLAAVSPGNVPSFRALLAAGFEPVGSVQVYRPDR